jgi:hypothetical protein
MKLIIIFLLYFSLVYLATCNDEILINVKVEKLQDEILLQVSAWRDGSDRRDVKWVYLIKNERGDIIFKKEETIAMGSSISFVRVISLPKKEGRYIVEVTAMLDGKKTVSTTIFEVESNSWQLEGLQKIDFEGMKNAIMDESASVIPSILIFTFWRSARKKMRRKRDERLEVLGCTIRDIFKFQNFRC